MISGSCKGQESVNIIPLILQHILKVELQKHFKSLNNSVCVCLIH